MLKISLKMRPSTAWAIIGGFHAMVHFVFPNFDELNAYLKNYQLVNFYVVRGSQSDWKNHLLRETAGSAFT